MPLSLFLYVRFVNGHQGWNGFTRGGFRNWGPMLRLAVPGVLMIEAEFLAFELLTLFASYFGTRALAAQAVLASLSSLLYQVPFAIGIASCMRVGHHVGAGFGRNARISSKAALTLGTVCGVLNAAVLILAKDRIGHLFSDDIDVISEFPILAPRQLVPISLVANAGLHIELVGHVVPILALFQVADVLASVSGGILRGQGRQYMYVAPKVSSPYFCSIMTPIADLATFKSLLTTLSRCR